MATKAQGTLLQRGDGGSPETFSTIAELVNIEPKLEGDELDVTSHSSVAGWREFVMGLRGGTVDLEGNFLPANITQSASAGLGLDFKNGTVRNFKLIFPDTGLTTWSFSAIVSKFDPAAPVKDKLGFKATLRITGVPTLA